MLEAEEKGRTSFGYRPDIDGLRAIAVTLVVAYHAGWPGFGGGFAGVDVFFVISGFLITSLLLHEHESQGRIRLAAFYARRIRRILPALMAVLLATLVAGFFLLTPVGEQQGLAQSALAATGFVSNLYFMQANTGYFAEPAQGMVLLHTWSLGIEEQFYLVWPLLILGAAAIARHRGGSPRRWLAPVVAAGAIAGFLGCLLILERSEAAAFYFTPFRAWELAIGAFLALAGPLPSAARLGAVLGMGGLGALLFTGVFLTAGAGFPMAAFAAAFGAAMIIAGGALSPSGPVTRLLSTRPLVAVGKLSYAWYLWHWPLLSLGRLHDVGAPSAIRDAVLVLLALGLAVLTRLMVERPSTTRWAAAFSPSRRAFRTGAILSASCVLLAAGLWLWADTHRTSTPLLAAVDRAVRHRIAFIPACDGTEDHRITPLPDQCAVGATSSAKAVMVWGDSHARHLVPGLADAATAANVAILPQHKSGCRPGLTAGRFSEGVERRREDRCRAFNRAVMARIDELRKSRRLDGIVIASRWSRDDGWQADLDDLLKALHGRGLRVLIVADPPFYPFDVPACLARRGVARCSSARGAMTGAQAADTASLRRIASATPGVQVWDPATVLCRAGLCDLMASGEVLYSDWHHLSPAGSTYLGRFLAEPLEWIVGEASADDLETTPSH